MIPNIQGTQKLQVIRWNKARAMQAVVQVFPGNLRAKFGQPLANHNAVMALSLETGVLLLPGIRVDCQGAKPRRKSCWNKRFIETCKF